MRLCVRSSRVSESQPQAAERSVSRGVAQAGARGLGSAVMGAFHVQRVVRLGLFIVPLLAGCQPSDEESKSVRLEGSVEKIKINADGTGEITVLYRSEKQKEEVAGTALVTRETEIMISGAAATLRDVHEGERIRGDVRVDKKEGKRVFTALKIHVDRAQPQGGAGG